MIPFMLAILGFLGLVFKMPLLINIAGIGFIICVILVVIYIATGGGQDVF